MRPVNLIPLEERRGEHAPLRSGPLAYIVVGALVAMLAGVTALVLTGNQVADRKSEVAQLEREDAVKAARAQRLSAYTQFRSLHEERVATVTSLADSRFDWERVMRELSLILPHDVWLISLDASASAGAESGGAGESSGSSSLTGSIAGPSLAISGCATSHEAVAGFVTALKDIDGVTRVGVESSEVAAQEEGASSASGSGDSESCTGNSVAKFNLVVAFDAAPVPATGSSEEALPSAPEQAQTTAATTEGSEGG